MTVRTADDRASAFRTMPLAAGPARARSLPAFVRLSDAARAFPDVSLQAVEECLLLDPASRLRTAPSSGDLLYDLESVVRAVRAVQKDSK